MDVYNIFQYISILIILFFNFSVIITNIDIWDISLMGRIYFTIQKKKKY